MKWLVPLPFGGDRNGARYRRFAGMTVMDLCRAANAAVPGPERDAILIELGYRAEAMTESDFDMLMRERGAP